MPLDNPKIVTGMREPHHTGQVSKPMNEPLEVEGIRRQKLLEGQVEFHSLARRYRVEFERPKQQLNPATGEIIEEGPRFLQFDGRRCVSSNPNLIHQAIGCENVIPNMMVTHQHTPYCPKGCQARRCSLSHQNPRNATQNYFHKHPSYGIKGDFWDASEMDSLRTQSNREKSISDFKALAASVTAEDMPEFLRAAGIESFQLPPREVPKEANK